jgi:hypothetical protein
MFKTGQFIDIENKSVIAWVWRWEQGLTTNGLVRILGVVVMFYNWIVMMVTQLHSLLCKQSGVADVLSPYESTNSLNYNF